MNRENMRPKYRVSQHWGEWEVTKAEMMQEKPSHINIWTFKMVH